MRTQLAAACAFVLAMLPSAPLRAQGICFNPAVNFSAGTYPASVFAADLDGDGDQDLAIANNTVSGGVAVLENNGTGTYAAPVSYPAGSQTMSVFAADLDGDGDLDLAAANQSTWDVSVLKNNGDATFGAAINYPAGNGPNAVFAADLDGDGDRDLAVANRWGGNVSVLKNNGNATFVAAVDYPAGDGPYSIVAAYLDADGNRDLAVANFNGNDVSILKNLGAGTFATPVNYAVGTNPVSVFAADLDGNGVQDLVAANNGSENVSVLKNNGDATFAAKSDYSAGNGPSSVYAADLDDDNRPDLAVTLINTGEVAVLKNNENGTFASPVSFWALAGSISVVATDVDNDFDLDLAVANLSANKVSVLKNCTLPLCFETAVNYTTGGYVTSVIAADLDGDGDQDVAAANGGFAVMKNNGSGIFADPVSYSFFQWYPYAVCVGDLDGDGDLDLAGANFSSGSYIAMVLKNNGDGTFVWGGEYLAPHSRSIVAADLDGDGDRDLVLANPTTNSVSVLKNNGDASFAAAIDYPVGATANGVCAADLNGDGALDLAVARFGGVAVLRNNGNGTFAAATNYPAGSSPWSVTAADLDGDGDLDLAVANSGGNDVSVVMNDGNGEFNGTVAHYTVGSVPVSVIAADLDGDGHQDLAAANQNSGTISVLRNDGHGIFGASSNFAAADMAYSLCTADFDKDGDLDLGVATGMGIAKSPAAFCCDGVAILKNCGIKSLNTVSNLGDSGPGSMRSAIVFTNTNPGRDSIKFAVAGDILPLTPLLPLSDPTGGTWIEGFTAPGASSPFTPTVALDGRLCTLGSGLRLQSSRNHVVGLMIRGFDSVGIAVIGSASVENVISGCRIYGNTDIGIDLGNNGVTPNDPGDVDNGPNTLLNYPMFDSVLETTPGVFTVFGTTVRAGEVELFLAAEPGNPVYQPETFNHGPAYQMLGRVRADVSGIFSFASIAKPEWSLVTATVTDTMGNTSEFSQNEYLTPNPLRITSYSQPQSTVRALQSLPLVSPAIQMVVYSPPDSVAEVDSIGPSFNTFGSQATYDSLTDYDSDGLPDTRVRIASPDTGEYKIKYILIGAPGDYLTGIGIDGHAEVQSHVAFSSVGQTNSATLRLAPPLRGELNGDGLIDVFDVIASIDIVFSGGPDPQGLADVNCDNVADVFDVIYLIEYAFSGGAAPCQ